MYGPIIYVILIPEEMSGLSGPAIVTFSDKFKLLEFLFECNLFFGSSNKQLAG